MNTNTLSSCDPKRMKAAVVTLHNVCNYGTQLQAYATQEKLKQYFSDVVFIDYRRNDTYGVGLLRTFTRGNPLIIPIILPTLIYWKYLFGKFQKKNLKLSESVYLNESDFIHFKDNADIYFSGSDQVWNPEWNKGIIPAYYLSFVPEHKPKYAYASSFGKLELAPNEINESKKFIERYKKISVREESGVTILKQQYGFQKAVRILDPTLSMTPDYWRKVETPNKIKGDYILIYCLKRNIKLDKYAKELSRRTGFKLYRFCTRFDQVFKIGKSIVIPEIFDFVTLIDHAKIVLTDSFHATAFSMNLGTEPICVYPESFSCRLSDFLELVDSKQRHIKSYDDFDVLNRHVDFNHVNKILNAEREKTDQFLIQILNDEGV